MSATLPTQSELTELWRWLTPLERDELDKLLRVWTPRPHQIPPEGDWFVWILLAGRGAGKTDALAHYINQHVQGPPCMSSLPGGHRIAIIAPTLGDAVEACVEGPSGLRAHNPAIRLTGGGGGAHVRWPNGAVAKLFGSYSAEDVERLRAGGNRCVVWAEELAAWIRLEEAWDHMSLGLRLGKRPHVVASTTPKARKRLLELLAAPTTVVSRAATSDNPYLDARVRSRLYERYEGTRLGRQELGGEVLLDTPGALWTRDNIDAHRLWEAPPMRQVVIAVDPSGGEGPENDEQGIVAAGVGHNARGYVLGDYTCKLSPAGWGAAVVKAYLLHEANHVVAEANFGGQMVSHVIKTIDPTIPVKLVTASRGKAVRAEPIAALDTQGKVSHVGSFPDLEDEMCTWDPTSTDRSPNRMDARVWALSALMLDGGRPFTSAVGGTRTSVDAYNQQVASRYAATRRG